MLTEENSLICSVKEIYFNNNEDKITKYAILESMKNEINIYKIYEEDINLMLLLIKILKHLKNLMQY